MVSVKSGADVVKDQRDKEGAWLDSAKKDLKGLDLAIKTAREIRKEMAITIHSLKKKIKDLDRQGGGRKSAVLERTLAFYREQYNEFLTEMYTYRAQKIQVVKFISDQTPVVQALDTVWEDLRK